jgi:hypothetical protein
MTSTPSAASAGHTDKGFFGALFDFSFTTFVTLKFIKVIYGALVGLILLLGVIFFFVFIMRGGETAILSFTLVPLATLFYLVVARISLETTALFFRIGENTSIMAGRGAAPAGPVAPYATGDAGYGPGPVPNV